ncbi:MAG: hypothetical protein GY858_09955 [Candidatus Omnitrophica bacterium]|nr:hypothetical protein [Candidatus Omnitrophota bacterium]
MKSKELSPKKEEREIVSAICPLGKDARGRIKRAIDGKDPVPIGLWLTPESDVVRVTNTRLLIIKEDTEEEIDITGSAPGFIPATEIFGGRFVKIHPIDVNKAQKKDVYALLRRLKNLKKTHYLGIEISAETEDDEDEKTFSDADESYELPPEEEKQIEVLSKSKEKGFLSDLENSKTDKESSPFREKNLLENQLSPKQAKENLEGSKSPKEEK